MEDVAPEHATFSGTDAYYRKMNPLSLDDIDPDDPRYTAQSGGLELSAIEKKLRMQKVLALMKDEDVDLLFDRYVDGRTQEAIAAERGVTREAIVQRLVTARRHFITAFTAAWNTEV